MFEEQISLFGDDISEPKTDKGNRIDVAKLDFVAGESVSWEQLFSGYDTLYAITYSSGISFICELLSLFEKAEIIFGCEQVMSYSVCEVVAFQSKLIEKINENKSQKILINRIKDNSLKLRVARKKLSHEKIYLLSAADGRKRVVMGSANMSHQAFSGRQRENIAYIDGDDAYEWYMSVYNSLKEESTDDITEKAILVADGCDNVDELPISQTVKMNKALAITPDKEMFDDVQFALDVSKLSAKISCAKPKADKKGKILLSPTTITTMRSQLIEAREREQEKRKEYPQLVVDSINGTVELNDKELDLSPAKDDVKHDVDLFLQYMKGYEIFHGDFAYMQQRYYEFANWFFCSPFMAVMRDTARRYNQPLLPYPIFGLVYGQSKAGKTSFLETLLKMMIGQKTRISAPEFTRKSIDGLRYEVKGAPIIVDDLTQTRFSQHAVETIKNDDFGLSDMMLNYPAVVISANEDIKAVAQEITRRTVICRVKAGLTNTEVMKSNLVRKVQKNIGTAFYREYLRRMLERIPEMVEELKDEESDSAPDILKVSSEILYDIFTEYSDEELPVYVRKLTMDDYFSERVTGKHAIQTIRTAWQTSREHFMIDKSINELRYNAGQSYDADRIIKELPENLEPRKSREWIIMNLNEAKAFFEIDFRFSLLDKIKLKR